jgi:inhibitor of cysteine peptidase
MTGGTAAGRFAGGLLALALIAAACGDDGRGVVVVDEGDAGSRVTVERAGRLEVELEGNPTTGYTWEVERAGVMTLVHRSHQPDSDAEGSGGVSTLVFEPTKTGSGDLVLVYLRQWEEDVAPLDTYTITVSVVE